MKEQEKTELTEVHDENKENEEHEWKDACEIQNKDRKMNRVTGFGITILILAVIVLSVCVVYSQNINKNLAEKTVEVQNEYKKLQESIKKESAKAGITETPQKDGTDGASSASSDEQQAGTNQEKVLTIPESTAEYVPYENYIEGKKFSFSYPSYWDGKVIFSNETQDDGTVVITCYASSQYSDYQNGASETGEIFHIVVNKNPAYQSEKNKQYKMSEKDGYCGYYEEPSGITYDYVNHPEYAEVFKLVYESQAKVWRSFNFE